MVSGTNKTIKSKLQQENVAYIQKTPYNPKNSYIEYLIDLLSELDGWKDESQRMKTMKMFYLKINKSFYAYEGTEVAKTGHDRTANTSIF